MPSLVFRVVLEVTQTSCVISALTLLVKTPTRSGIRVPGIGITLLLSRAGVVLESCATSSVGTREGRVRGERDSNSSSFPDE